MLAQLLRVASVASLCHFCHYSTCTHERARGPQGGGGCIVLQRTKMLARARVHAHTITLSKADIYMYVRVCVCAFPVPSRDAEEEGVSSDQPRGGSPSVTAGFGAYVSGVQGHVGLRRIRRGDHPCFNHMTCTHVHTFRGT